MNTQRVLSSMTTLPRLQTIPQAARSSAALIHLSPLLGYMLPSFGHLLGPALAWLLLRDRDPALDDQGKEALNFQLSLTLYSLILSALFTILFMLGFLGGLGGGLLTAIGLDPSGVLAALGFMGPFAVFFAFLIPMLLLFSLLPLFFMILAVLRVNQGQPYRYPLTLRLIR